MDMTEQERYYELLESDENAPETQYELGLCYLYGKGTEQNGAEADKWLRRAAEQGYERAIALLEIVKPERENTDTGVTEETLPDWCVRAEEGDVEAQYQVACYFIRERTEGAEEDTIRFLESAAEQGHPQACYELGLQRLRAEDAEAGVKMLCNAADCGVVKASEQLGVCYSFGIGVKQDPAEAERRFEDAARLGNAEDKLALAVRLGAGDGVEKSLGKAMRWLKEAQDAGMEDARMRYEEEVKRTCERIAAAREAEARRRAEEEVRRAQERERIRQEMEAERERARREMDAELERRRAQEAEQEGIRQAQAAEQERRRQEQAAEQSKQPAQQPDCAAQENGQTRLTIRTASLLCYWFSFIGGLISYLLADNKDTYLRFHLNQSLILWIGAEIVGMMYRADGLLHIIGSRLAVGVFLLWLIAFINAYKGEMKSAPLLDKIPPILK